MSTRRPATPDLPRQLIAALARARRPLATRELALAVGVRTDVVARALSASVAAGVVRVQNLSRPGGGRPGLAYALVAGGADSLPAPPAESRPERQRRTCLSCGTPFLSSGPGNRLCARGTCRGQSGSGCFDTPHTVRYR